MVNNTDETVANRNGAHVDSSSMPAGTTGIKNEPTYAASADIPESTPLTNRPREDSPPGPPRKACGVLYEEEGEHLVTFACFCFAHTLVMPQRY